MREFMQRHRLIGALRGIDHEHVQRLVGQLEPFLQQVTDRLHLGVGLGKISARQLQQQGRGCQLERLAILQHAARQRRSSPKIFFN